MGDIHYQLCSDVLIYNEHLLKLETIVKVYIDIIEIQ